MMSEKNKARVKFLSQFLPYFAIASLAFLAIGLKNIENYPDWAAFSSTMLVAGVLIGITLYIILCYFIPGAGDYKNKKGMGLMTPVIFAFSLIAFGTGRMINESSPLTHECKEYVIQRMSESSSTRKAYFVFIDNGHKIERLNFGEGFHKMHKAGDRVSLCVVTGRLGFRYYKVDPEAPVLKLKP